MVEQFLATLHSAGAFVAIISIIVFIHEYGHYFVAKVSGVRVEAFSIGFGPEIFGWNDRSGTRWKVSLLPLGGYVKMFGDVNPASAPDHEAIDAMDETELAGAFHAKPLGIKAAIVAAGPIANFILSIAILVGFYTLLGKDRTEPVVEQVVAGSAAFDAGIQAGDRIVSLDGQAMATMTEVSRYITVAMEREMVMVVERSSGQQTLRVTPKITEREDAFGNRAQAPSIGIQWTPTMPQTLSFPSALLAATQETYALSVMTLQVVGQMITGTRGLDDMSGPLRIAKYSGQSVDKGWLWVWQLMMIISLNLGLINLFPIPLLDGGHLLYYAVEAVIRRPIPERVQEWGFRLGMVMILALAVFATYNDLRQLDVFSFL